MNYANSAPNRRAPRPSLTGLLLAATITGLHFLSLSFSQPIFPLLATELGAGSGLIGLLTSLSYLLPLFIALPAGALINRLGIRAVALAGSVCLLVGNAAYAAAGGFALLAAARVLNGLAQVVVLVAVQAYVAELGRGGQQDRNFATIFFFAGLGKLSGPIAAGYLAREFSLRVAFWAAAGLAVLPLGLALGLPGALGQRSLGDPARADQPAQPGAARRGGLNLGAIGRLLRLSGVRLGVGASLIMLLAQGARESFYPLFAESIGFDEVAIGALMSVHALSSIVVQPFAGSLAAAWGRPRVLSLAMLCGFLGSATVPLMRSFLPLAVATALAGMALGANQPPSMACVAEAAPKELRGVAMALRLTGNRLALLLSPIIAGGLATLWGLPAYFYCAAGMLIGGSALMGGVARATPARGATVGVDAPPAEIGPGER